MLEVVKSESFERWHQGLNDLRAAARIQVRIDRLANGNPGDVKPVGHGISELRINFGPGYRVYYRYERDLLILLLMGGDKSSQAEDIREARRIDEHWRKHGREG